MKYEDYEKYNFAKNLRFLVSKIDDLEKKYLKAKKIDISQRELDYIALIGSNVDKPFTDLIKQESISKSTFSNQVKTLVSKDLVEYESFNGSKKAKTLKLTPKGQNIYSVYEEIRIIFFERFVDGKFTKPNLDSINKAVEKLLRQLKSE